MEKLLECFRKVQFYRWCDSQISVHDVTAICHTLMLHPEKCM